MTLNSPPDVGASRRGRLPNVLGGLAAVFLLAVMVVVPPVGLSVFVGNPVPDQAVVAGRLTDDAVIGMLAAVVWLAWAQLMLAVLVEAAAALRGSGLPRRIPLCGPQQLLARRLVVAIAFLLAGSATTTSSFAGTAVAATAAAACVPAAPVPAVDAPAINLDGNPHETSAPAARAGIESATDGRRGFQAFVPPRPEAGLWYTVKPPQGRHHDTLWDIAERHLGDGLRWKDIYGLNKHRPQPDGKRLEVANLILPGWRLLLPADAVGIRPDAAEHSDDATRAGDGRKHDRPARAEAGAAGSSAERLQGPAAQPAPEREINPPGKAPGARSGGVVPPARAMPPSVDAGSKPKAEQRAKVRSGAATVDSGESLTDRQDRASDRGDVDDDEPAIPFGVLTLGLTVLAAAGLTGELARRRRRAQRFRLPGSRLPVPDRPQTQVERQLRTANAEVTVAALRDALRGLAVACRQSNRGLPDVHAVLLNAQTTSLLLGSDDSVAVGPFVATGPRTWTLQQSPSADTEAAADPDDVLDPYPALVSIGVTDDAVVLLNLEAAGTLHIDGPADVASEIACALAAELGTSALSATLELALSGCPGTLAAVTDAGRTRHLPAGSAPRWAAARLRAVGDALGSSGLDDLAAARSLRKAPDLWAPAVLVDIATPGASEAQLPIVAPYRGLILITNRPNAAGAGWSLRCRDNVWRLEPLGLDLEPQRIPDAQLATAVDLLCTTEEDTAASGPGDTDTGEPRRWAVTTVRTNPPAGPTDLAAIAAAIPQPPSPDVEPPDAAAGPPRKAAPRVLVLGPVEVTGAADGLPARRRRSIELISYLALHPGASQHQIDEALWPGLRVTAETRNPLVSRTRKWLGMGADDQPYLALVAEGGLYTLQPEVSCDWHDFCALARSGLAAGPDGIDNLAKALDLVRGRPFLGVTPAAYTWAEGDTQDMISAIVDVAHVLAELALEAGDPRRARWAAAKGMLVDPCAELLYQDAIRAAQDAGDPGDIARLIECLRRSVTALDPDDDCGDPMVRARAETRSGA